MSKLSDILDSGLFTDEEGRPDYRTGKVKKEIKDLMLELIPGDNYAPTGSQTIVEAVNAERQRMRQKVEAL